MDLVEINWRVCSANWEANRPIWLRLEILLGRQIKWFQCHPHTRSNYKTTSKAVYVGNLHFPHINRIEITIFIGRSINLISVIRITLPKYMHNIDCGRIPKCARRAQRLTHTVVHCKRDRTPNASGWSLGINGDVCGFILMWGWYACE